MERKSLGSDRLTPARFPDRAAAGQALANFPESFSGTLIYLILRLDAASKNSSMAMEMIG